MSPRKISPLESSITATPPRETKPLSSGTAPSQPSRVRRVPLRLPREKCVTFLPSARIMRRMEPLRRLYMKCALSVTICTTRPFCSQVKTGLSKSLSQTLCVGSSQKLPFSTLTRQGVSTLKRVLPKTTVQLLSVTDAVLTSNLFIISLAAFRLTYYIMRHTLPSIRNRGKIARAEKFYTRLICRIRRPGRGRERYAADER